ncbi:hypothetical protein EJ03DRAFT_343851 [Teratosphaeria nubilosa]|uniref:Zn(2)-C6 fungal-type domain-containing protein n=1 Tax=Teratosphaeria nubilosa TaxID=161662 RepID=A0A6G1L712_9PEZI|nr:hypothetical protein EJ03DRAFT_343851 [Teratosphaeria nubilosa]
MARVEQQKAERRAGPSQGTAAPPPRKRRRRTAAGGATDDCFTCRKRGAQCDRNRPYCTQCLEIGKECSGYKTTLTWGVGVASRGKLRGLSCPIASTSLDAVETPSVDAGRKRKKSYAAKSRKVEDQAEDTVGHNDPQSRAWPKDDPMQTSSLPPMSLLPQMQAGSAFSMAVPPMQQPWQMSDSQQQEPGRQDLHRRNLSSMSLPPFQHLHTVSHCRYDFNVPPSAVGSYAETEFHSPVEYPQTPRSVPISNQFADRQRVDQAGLTSLDNVLFDPVNISCDGMGAWELELQDGNAEHGQQNLAMADLRFGSPFFHLTPRMQSLLTYYDNHICPFLVAFDGPKNPYRQHILQLALNNEGLQNAIAALATNNLRMRKKDPRQVGFVEQLTNAFSGADDNGNNVTAEESLYKQLSIDQLNFQLTDTRAAQDDSVLATLLILCLFHVCDSGFSKFKTQLAGVQKLLSLRQPGIASDFTGWVEMFFTWFDVMTSTVNDREMQIKGENLDMLDFSVNLGALEQFSGCDGRLFKLIARLGTLNLLAQGRPVRSRSGRDDRASAQNAFRRPAQKQRTSNRSLSAEDYANIDGNGWGTPIISSVEDAEGSAEEDRGSAGTQPANNKRHEFWQEWNDIRTHLQNWHMDAPPSDSNDSSAETMNDPRQSHTGHRDLLHINESFRYSALLYTERLGNPCLPSAHPQFQTLVSQALRHITALSVTSCVNKFLLWPLFMVGTECVDGGHRDIIRQRCVEVHKESGFFNNISALEVLERVWREVGDNRRGREEFEVKSRRRDSEAGHRGRKYGQAFRWRKAMDRVDGEYIVI